MLSTPPCIVNSASFSVSGRHGSFPSALPQSPVADVLPGACLGCGAPSTKVSRALPLRRTLPPPSCAALPLSPAAPVSSWCTGTGGLAEDAEETQEERESWSYDAGIGCSPAFMQFLERFLGLVLCFCPVHALEVFSQGLPVLLSGLV